ncbi:anthranilate synthase component I family protein [Alteribacillus iranensis]|uniref:Aminodeoxychorismate synthase, subunit I n=1 Tax=Alteribacillus iranensis TaxID=930128 RepID=A0A1I2FGH4_9BACI|nr:anthranilate synthase component I family protein [Alteribacillus iranensis]SFF03837.1 aminodeoxychorismate synthase, subunit I [Alteribacillus iranensis]
MKEDLASIPDRSGGSYKTFGRSVPFPENQFFSAYCGLSSDRTYHVLLESGNRGRYSIAAFHPFAVIRGKEKVLTIQTQKQTETRRGDPLEEMKKWLSPYEVERNPSFPDFQGGILGYISYDYHKHIEAIVPSTDDDLETDDIYFLAFQHVFVYDHEEKKLWVIGIHTTEEEADKQINHYITQWEHARKVSWDNHFENWHPPHPKLSSNRKLTFTKDSFKAAVFRIQDYIRAGDTFQVNISVREEQTVKTPPLHIYEKLREINPSPYMGYFHTPDLQIVNGSPELLIKKRGCDISTRPIAGTRPRGESEDEDREYERDMLLNEKERAEHAMLVDLERNDLGKVCEYGSVKVDDFMTVERYSHVMHIVSHITGKLSAKTDVYGMIKAAFPGGTITGAPKIRTMEIIEELETVRRGIYTGSIGWIGYNQDTELNIVIRTMVVKGSHAYVQAGAGIVIDSRPEAEFEESLKKAKALWKAKELSEREMKARVKERSALDSLR